MGHWYVRSRARQRPPSGLGSWSMSARTQLLGRGRKISGLREAKIPWLEGHQVFMCSLVPLGRKVYWLHFTDEATEVWRVAYFRSHGR